MKTLNLVPPYPRRNQIRRIECLLLP